MRNKTSVALVCSLVLNAVLIGVVGYGAYVDTGFRGRMAEGHAMYVARKGSAITASRLESADVVFLGDSITDDGSWDEYFPGLRVVNRGVGGDRTEHVLERFARIRRLRPSKIFLMIGVNDLSAEISVGGIQHNYTALFDRFDTELPDTEIYLQGVLPVAADFVLVDAVNDKTAVLSEALKAQARERGYEYIDVRALFLDEAGFLSSEFTQDGIHLMGNAYSLWRDLVTPSVYGEGAGGS